jgi:hypothetical protein
MKLVYFIFSDDRRLGPFEYTPEGVTDLLGALADANAWIQVVVGPKSYIIHLALVRCIIMEDME